LFQAVGQGEVGEIHAAGGFLNPMLISGVVEVIEASKKLHI